MSTFPAGSERRVRQVILTAPNKTAAQRAAILLEDGLHTASIPMSSGRLLLVRQLHIGRIDTRGSSAGVALQIEEQMRRLATAALPAHHPQAGNAQAVFFPNRTEAAVSLAVRLAQGRPVRDWFWQPAVPAWQPHTGREANLRTLLLALGQGEDGPAAIVRLVTALLAEKALEPLLSVLTAADGEALLQFFGWQDASVEKLPDRLLSSEVGPIFPLLPLVVRRYLWRWPPGDSRAVWLAGMALVGERPIRLHDPGLGRRARLSALAAIRPASEMAAAGRPVEGEPGENPARTREQPAPRLSASADISPMNERRKTADKFAISKLQTEKENLSDISLERSVTNQAGMTAVGDEEFLADVEAPGPDLAGVGAFPQPQEQDFFQEEWALLQPESGYGGLFLLLPLLAHLGMGEWVQNESWIEAEFPVRLLELLCHRLRVTGDDPVWQVLKLEPEPVIKPDFFLAPTLWDDSLANGGWQLCRVKQEENGRHGLRILVDGSGRMPLAAWQGRMPPIVRSRLQSHPPGGCEPPGGFVRGRPLEPTTILELALKSWLVAVRRWCRRYARIGLHDLVGRPGRIDHTKTHLDIFFESSLVDIRIRRAGLDVNPGWLPWFGRVVTFHYLDSQEIYV